MRKQSPADPVLAMRGVGKEMFAQISGDEHVAAERRAWKSSEIEAPEPQLERRVWARLISHEGHTFFTARGLPFTYELEGEGLWIRREGTRINSKLSRRELARGVARCPVSVVTEVADLRNPSYLFGILMDERIADRDWQALDLGARRHG